MAEENKDLAWQRTLSRLGIGDVDISQVRPEDVLYLAKKWPFLQVVETSGRKKALDAPELLTAESGWTIHHYGDAMSTSPGRLIFGGGYFRIHTDDEDDGEGGGIVNPGKGTVVKQAFDSAAEMIRLAKQFGWDGVQIVDGHPDMQRAAWVEACRVGVRLDGYIPDMEAEKKRRRIVSVTIDEMREALKGISKRV